jgi:DNA mismatch repair protein MutS
VIERAKLILAELEAEDRTSHARRLIDDLPLFAASARPSPGPPTLDEAGNLVIAALAALNPDEMSPRQAIEALYALKAKAAEQK